MKDINHRLQEMIGILYIILIPVYFLLLRDTYNGGLAVIKTSLILTILSAFHYGMSKIEEVKILNLIYGILYVILFIGLVCFVFICDNFGIEHLVTCIILVLSIVCPFMVYWYFKKKGVSISMFILSFNFLVIILPFYILSLMLRFDIIIYLCRLIGIF